jgi:hypothetical protein
MPGADAMPPTPKDFRCAFSVDPDQDGVQTVGLAEPGRHDVTVTCQPPHCAGCCVRFTDVEHDGAALTEGMVERAVVEVAQQDRHSVAPRRMATHGHQLDPWRG